MNPRDYYKTPNIKNTILEFAEYNKNDLIFTKALVYDFKGWYTYNSTTKRMFQGNNPKAYNNLINH